MPPEGELTKYQVAGQGRVPSRASMRRTAPTRSFGARSISVLSDGEARMNVLAWEFTPTMAATDVQETLEKALANARLDRVRVRVWPLGLGCPPTTGRATCPVSSAGSSRPGAWNAPGGRPTTRKPKVLLG